MGRLLPSEAERENLPGLLALSEEAGRGVCWQCGEFPGVWTHHPDLCLWLHVTSL